MITQTDVSLITHHTFAVDAKAESIIHFESARELIDFFAQEKLQKPFLILGEGSNILFRKNFKGQILHPVVKGIEIMDEDRETILVKAYSGENWDEFVDYCVMNDYRGLENLSYIPGSVGAVPVQNIGAYGVEVSESIEQVETIEITTGKVRVFSNQECHFSYRNSIFKSTLKNRYFVLSVIFRLSKSALPITGYGSLKEEMKNYSDINIHNVRQAVISIRKWKLPDPAFIGNAGSFFKNPVVSAHQFQEYLNDYPNMPYYRLSSQEVKIPAGWLIEYCGWKGRRVGHAGVHEKQALVLVNYGKATGEEIVALAQQVKSSVYQEFGLELEEEVEII